MPLDEAERVLSLKIALKISDLGHTTASLPVHLKWVSRLEEEVRYKPALPQKLCPCSPLR